MLLAHFAADPRTDNAGMSMTTAAPPDVTIIGAGVIGLSCAYFLQQRGRRVRVLERGAVGSGTSHGNCGMISPSQAAPIAMPGLIPKALKWMWKPDAPLYIKPTLNPKRLAWLWRFARRCNWDDYWDSARRKRVLLERSRTLFDQIIVGERLDCDYAPVGHLVALRDAATIPEAMGAIERMHKLGIAAEWWDGATLAEREPALKPGLAGAIWNPEDGHFRPDRYVAELARIVRERGGEIRTQSPVVGFEQHGGRVTALRLADGQPVPVAGDVVLATGAWAPELGRQLDVKLRIEPVKGYSITTTCPPLMPRVSVVFRERGVAVTPWASGFRLGSTYEFSGFDHHHNTVRFAALKRAAAEYLREPIGAVVEEEWMGFRPMTVDGVPVIERIATARNVVVAAGHGTLGMSMSPATGEKVAGLLTR